MCPGMGLLNHRYIATLISFFFFLRVLKSLPAALHSGCPTLHSHQWHRTACSFLSPSLQQVPVLPALCSAIMSLGQSDCLALLMAGSMRLELSHKDRLPADPPLPAYFLNKKWNTFPNPWSSGWPSDMFTPREWRESDVLQVLGLILERPASFHFLPSGRAMRCQAVLLERQENVERKHHTTWGCTRESQRATASSQHRGPQTRQSSLGPSRPARP